MVTLFVACLALAQQGPSLLQQIIPNPTGNNGYEEYLMACDIVRDPQISFLLTATPDRIRQTIESQGPEYQLAKKHEASNILGLRREAVKLGGKAIDLVARGNKKPVFDPRVKVDWNDRFPEMRPMPALGSLLIAASYVAFAEGQSGRGTQLLVEAATLGHNIGGGSVLGRFIGVIIHENVFAFIESVLPNLSLPDAQLIHSLSVKLLTGKPLALRLIERNSALAESYFTAQVAAISASADAPEEGSEIQRSVTAMVKRLSPAERRQAIAECVRLTDRLREQLAALYQRPESEWGVFVDAEHSHQAETSTIRNTADLAAYLRDSFSRPHANLGRHEVRNRTQIRLIGLAAAVVEFKWEHDRLPTLLSEAVDEKLRHDPLANEPFQYEVQGAGFRVYSKGSKETGEIGLTYRQRDNDAIPPP